MIVRIFIASICLAALTACRPQAPLASDAAGLPLPSKPTATSSQDVVPSPVAVIPQAPAATPPSQPPAQPAPPESSTIDYPLGFASQAPYGVWDALHGEACEEASMAMVAFYLADKSITSHTMEQEILNLVAWESDHGYKIDVTTAEVVEILDEFYGVTARIVRDPSAADITRLLSEGNLVIIPAAGRELGNPYFHQPGPIYHMLVIRGYEAGEFITNDPGTKRGEAYRYPFATLMNAIHDWDHQRADGGMTDEEMSQGLRRIVVVPLEQ